MDYQEAIEILREGIKTFEQIPHLVDAYKTAISTMKELHEYHKTGMTPAEIIRMQHGYAVKMTDLEDYQRIGTLEEVREAVEKQAGCKHCGYKIHSENISKLNSCNDCGLKSTCKKRPEYGEYCRINCYDWSEEE